MIKSYEFGIYILTYPGDFYLSVPLVNSIRHFNPDVPIIIIPGNGFDYNHHPFDELAIMTQPDGFLGELHHMDRKYWAHKGPFHKFLYLDSDMICLNNIDVLIGRILNQTGNFMFTQHPEYDSIEQFERQALARSTSGQWGNIENLKKFDPEFNFERHYAFNAGIFAANRSALNEIDFETLHKKQNQFYRNELKKDFMWHDISLFYYDQGRWNYLIHKKKLEIINLAPDGHYAWGGNDIYHLKSDGTSPFSFIHWAGCPRPSYSVFNKGILYGLKYLSYSHLDYSFLPQMTVPGLNIWKEFSYNYEYSLKKVYDHSIKDLKLIIRGFFRKTLSKAGLLNPFRRIRRKH